ncbi:MAG: hypothetical protein HY738_21785 [Bacteroidia bacterium]|nr:hypothetical protein [Bacteroidia bacterium]
MQFSLHLIIFIVLIYISSCSSQLIPPAANIPLITEKHELQAEFDAGTSSFYANLAYSPANKFSIITSVNMSYENLDTFLLKSRVEEFGSLFGSFTPVPSRHKYFDLGAGYYFPYSNKVFEVYGGIGLGSSKSRYRKMDEKRYGAAYDNYYTGFVQLNYGKRSKILDSGFGMRISYSYYIDSYWNSETRNCLPLTLRTSYLNLITTEPNWFIRVGGEQLKITVRTGLFLILTHGFESKKIALNKYTNFNFLIGINYCFKRK